MGMTKRVSFPSSAAEHLPFGQIRNKEYLYTELEGNLQNGFHCLTYPVLGKNYSYTEHFYTVGLCITILHSPFRKWLSTASPQSYFLKIYNPFETGLSIAKNDQF